MLTRSAGEASGGEFQAESIGWALGVSTLGGSSIKVITGVIPFCWMGQQLLFCCYKEA